MVVDAADLALRLGLQLVTLDGVVDHRRELFARFDRCAIDV